VHSQTLAIIPTPDGCHFHWATTEHDRAQPLSRFKSLCCVWRRTPLYVYVFSRRFYPKPLANEDITMQLRSKLTISYIEGKPPVRLCHR